MRPETSDFHSPVENVPALRGDYWQLDEAALIRRVIDALRGFLVIFGFAQKIFGTKVCGLRS